MAMDISKWITGLKILNSTMLPNSDSDAKLLKADANAKLHPEIYLQFVL